MFLPIQFDQFSNWKIEELIEHLEELSLILKVENPESNEVYIVPFFLLNQSKQVKKEAIKLSDSLNESEFSITIKLESPISTSSFRSLLRDLFDKHTTKSIWQNGILNVDFSCHVNLTYTVNKSKLRLFFLK